MIEAIQSPAFGLAALAPDPMLLPDHPTPTVVGLGVANPDYEYTQSQLADWLIEHYGYSGRVATFVRRLHRRSGIRTRFSVLPDFGEDGSRHLFRSGQNPTIADRMAVFEECATKLAVRAVTSALSRCRTHADEVTHMILVTSTGFMTPGPDVAIQRAIGLDPRVERTIVSMHGCAGGTTGLALAAQIVRAEERARVLLICVEICSIHLGSGEGRQDIVANSLFADGAVAAVVQRVRSEDERGAILGHRRMLTIDGSEEVLRWTLLPSGFRLTLGRDLPSTIRRALLSLSGDAASFATPRPRDSHRPIRWIAHAGGVAVLDAVRRTLDLPASALESASSTLERYGNLSSASVLYALHWELENPCSDNRSQPGVLLSFGPGMCVDAIGCTLRGGHY